ncbi:MAG: hypothetical protein AB8B50_00495 [Pirellulaceae bacterium]
MQEPTELEFNIAGGHPLRGAERTSRDSNWLLYTRLLGSATSACIVSAILLHELQCEVSSQPTHWLSALIIASLAAVSLVTHFPSKLPGASSLFLLVSSAAIAILLLLVADLCDEHWTSCVTLLAMNSTASWFVVRELPRRLHSSNSKYHGSKLSDYEHLGE